MKKRTVFLILLVSVACMLIAAGCSGKRYYVVTYETAGGTIAAQSRSVQYGKEFILDVPSRNDATFLGWFQSAEENAEQITDCYGKSLGKYTLTNDSTVYAKWEYWDTEGLEYSLASDGSGYIVFAPENFAGELVKVPSEYNGLPVVRVGEYAFFESNTLTHVVLPDTVRSIGAYAFDTCNQLEVVEGTAKVERVEERAFYKCTSLTRFGFGDKIGYIGGEAFSGCSLLPSADFGLAAESVTMEASAFSGCTALSLLVLPQDMPIIPASAFAACTSLQQVRIEGNVRQISDGAFSSCINMRSLHIGATANSLGTNALSGCTYLSEITVDENNQAFSASDNILYSKDGSILYRYAPYKEGTGFTAPSNVTHIGSGAFADNENLTELTLNSTVTLIDSGAFTNMQHLADIVLPFVGGSPLANTWFSYVFGGAYSDMTTNVPYTLKNVTVLSGNLVSERAFQFCNTLSVINLPDTLTAIGAYAFYGCAALTDLVLPAGVESIGDFAFVACTRLQSVSFGGENGYFTTENGLLYNKEKTKLILYPSGKADTEFTVPDTVTEIGDNAFYYASKLRTVILPMGLVSIGNSAFYNCRALVSVDLPSTVQSVGSQAFADCLNLTTVRLSENLSVIGRQAFYDCAKLSVVTVTAQNPPNIEDAVFLNVSEDFIILFEDEDVKAAYAQTGWSEYEAHFDTADDKIAATVNLK